MILITNPVLQPWVTRFNSWFLARLRSHTLRPLCSCVYGEAVFSFWAVLRELFRITVIMCYFWSVNACVCERERDDAQFALLHSGKAYGIFAFRQGTSSVQVLIFSLQSCIWLMLYPRHSRCASVLLFVACSVAGVVACTVCLCSVDILSLTKVPCL